MRNRNIITHPEKNHGAYGNERVLPTTQMNTDIS